MISIIIPTYQERRIIKHTLGKLRVIKDFDYEIIVSDGGSTDGTIEIAQKMADKIVVEQHPELRNIPRGKNAGAAIAQGDFLAFIDADVEIPEPDRFFKRALSLFNKNSRLLGLTVPIRVLPQMETFADRFFYGLLNNFYIFINNYLHKGNSSGEFQMIRAAAFRKLRGFREDLPAGEDNDMFIRLSKIGRTMSDPNLYVFHTGRRPHKLGWPKTFYIWIKNGLSIMVRNKAAVKDWEVIR